jgi:hypothetical protein
MVINYLQISVFVLRVALNSSIKVENGSESQEKI